MKSSIKLLCPLSLSLSLSINCLAQVNIIGGYPIDISEAPWQVSVETADGLHRCGGSILTDRWILTAAHCYYQGGGSVGTPNLAGLSWVHAGSTDQSNNIVGQRISIQQSFIHPDFVAGQFPTDHDIALLYLSAPLQFNSKVQPIISSDPCNTNESDLSSGTMSTLTGWGFTAPVSPPAQNLRAAELPIISVDQANLIQQNNPNATILDILPEHLPFYQAGIFAGSGDSGGPHVLDKDHNKILIGTHSYTYGSTLFPAYTPVTVDMKVLNYATWITQTTGIQNSKPGVDLYMKDRPWDLGREPGNVDFPWASEDIWIRNQNDGLDFTVHQNPLYSAGSTKFVYVRVRNRGCSPSMGTEQLMLYWGKASTAMYWPTYWNGSVTLGSGGPPLGGIIGSQTIPIVEPGSSVVLTFAWNSMPNPQSYQGINSEPWHFCLLGRIVSSNDPMHSNETIQVYNNVQNNNNIAWKNFSIVSFMDEEQTEYMRVDGGTVVVGGDPHISSSFDFQLTEEQPELKSLWREAEIILKLDEILWQRWSQTGRKGNGIEVFRESARWIKITAEPAIIEDITLNPGEYARVGLQFGFLTREATERVDYNYHLIQKMRSSGAIVGGELFKVIKPNPQRPIFYAQTGSNTSIKQGEEATVSAWTIGEPAQYNWYDGSGTLLFSGSYYQIHPDSTMTLKLEVIADADGFKDYSLYELNVERNFIESIYPNPAGEILNVNYKLNEGDVTDAQITLLPHTGGGAFQYALNIQSQNVQLLLNQLPPGMYNALLIVDGVPKNNLNFLKY